MTTYIECNEDLYNDGRCFTEGKIYEVKGNLHSTYSLIDVTIINDMGERHTIGNFHKSFTILDND